MDEKIKNDEKNVMLVRDAGKKGTIEAVSQIDENGNIQTVAAASSNLANLFNVYTNDSAIESFLKKFLEEMQAPVKTGISDIFIMPEAVLEKLFKVDLDPQLLEHYRVDPAAELSRIEQLRDEGQRFQPMDISKIDRADMERKGIRLEDLKPHLKAMSYGHKSHGLIEMYPEMEPGGMRVTTKGRVSLEEQPDGSLKVIPHYYREKCDLDAPFHGVLLDEETKRNITETRHAGKVLELELEEGKLTPCFVSRDKWTNELVAMPVSEIERFSRLKNVELTEGKQIDLFSGGKVLLEGYTTRSGYKRDAYIQIDASERNIEFDHSGLDRKRYQEQNREIYQQKRAEEGNALPSKQQGMFIPQRLFGVEVPKEAYIQWQEALNFPEKQKDVKAVYMRGLQFPGSAEQVDRWVKPNFEEQRIRTYRWNPDYARRQAPTAQQQAPQQSAQTQPGKPRENQAQPRQEVRQRQVPQQRKSRSKGVGGL